MKKLICLMFMFTFISIFCIGNVYAKNVSGLKLSEAKQNLAAKNYLKMCKHLKKGKIKSAAKLTNDRSVFTEQLTKLKEQIGDERFTEHFSNCGEVIIHSFKEDNDHSVLIINTPTIDLSPISARFYVKKNARSVLEIINPNEFPCGLSKYFNEAKGEPDAELSGCKE